MTPKPKLRLSGGDAMQHAQLALGRWLTRKQGRAIHHDKERWIASDINKNLFVGITLRELLEWIEVNR